MNSVEFLPTLEKLVERVGYARAQEVIGTFGVLYRVHHHNDHSLYVGMTKDVINEKYQGRRLEVLKRYLGVYYKVKT